VAFSPDAASWPRLWATHGQRWTAADWHEPPLCAPALGCGQLAGLDPTRSGWPGSSDGSSASGTWPPDRSLSLRPRGKSGSRWSATAHAWPRGRMRREGLGRSREGLVRTVVRDPFCSLQGAQSSAAACCRGVPIPRALRRFRTPSASSAPAGTPYREDVRFGLTVVS